MDKENDVSVKDLLKKTKKELFEVAQRLGVAVEPGARKAGIISAIAKELREGADAGSKFVEEGRKRAKSAAANASKRLRGAAKGTKKAAARDSRVRKAVASVVKKTAEMAERLMLGEPRAAVSTSRYVMTPAPVARSAQTQAPVGGETAPTNGDGAVVHGTGQAEAMKFSIAEKPEPQTFVKEEYLGELPEGYGSNRIFVVGRDPNWLFLYWDLSGPKLQEIKSRSEDGRMYLQILDVTEIMFDGYNAHRTLEYIVPDNARNWYSYVNAPNRDFVARLGSRTPHGFEAAVVSRRVKTPPDDFSARTDAVFVTIPFHISFARLLEMIREVVKEPADLAVAIAGLQARGVKLPFDYTDEKGIVGFFEEFVGTDGEKYRKFLLGSEELLMRLKKEVQMNLNDSSGASGAFGGGS